MSTDNQQELPFHNLSNIRRVTIDAGHDELIVDSENFQDIRIEMNSIGHNLTSVLMNPRETMLEDIFDEFAFEQSTPLEYQSPFTDTNGKSNTSMISLSVHSALKYAASSSKHSNNGKMSNDSGSTSGSIYNSIGLFTMTVNEAEQLEQFVARMNKIFTHYERVHQHHSSHASSVSPYTNNNRSRSDSNSNSNGIHGLTPAAVSKTPKDTSPRRFNHRKFINDDLRNCYTIVPDLFFRPDFSLSNQEMFHMVFGAIDLDMIIEKMKILKGTGGDGPSHQYSHSVDDSSSSSSSYRKTIEDHLMLSTPIKQSNNRSGKNGQLSISKPSSSPKKSADGEPLYVILKLQDQLSAFLDLVEMALLRQIYARSPSFFRTLDDIRSLQFAVGDTTRHLIHEVRERLQSSDINSSSYALVIPKMHNRQNNMTVLAEKLTHMSEVFSARTTILLLLEAEDYITALELISSTKAIYNEHNLHTIQAMKAIGQQLNEYDNLVCEIMCNKFVSMAIQWEDDVCIGNDEGDGITDSINGVDHMSQMYEEFSIKSANNNGKNGHTTKSTLQAANEASLRQLLHSLVVTERVQSALGMYKHRLLEAIRLIVRTCVMEYLVNFDPSIAYGDTELEESTEIGGPPSTETPFGQRVREMNAENFLACLDMCFEHVILSLQKANVFHSFIETELGIHIYLTPNTSNKTLISPKHLSGGNTPNSPPCRSIATATSTAADQQTQRALQETLRNDMVKMSKDCLKMACDLAQKSISKLITLRKENNAKLDPLMMKQVWSMSLRFIVQLEEIFVSTAYVLRQCLLSQTTSFLKYIHETYKGKLVNTLDNERFTQCDVTKERQDEINRLVSGKAFLQVAISGTSQLNTHFNDDQGSGKSMLTSSTSDSVKGTFLKDKQAKPVLIDGCEYKVIWSALLLVECIMTYLEIAINFTPVTPDVINCTDELLNLFESRTQQLILGAQATKSAARLKSISIKHLAITGQSISLIMTLIPHLRAALLAQLQTRQQVCLIKLDETSHTYSNHHNSIVEKFGSIVSDVVDLSAQKLKSYNWDNRNETSCEYFADLKKNVVVVHTTLLAVFPVTQIQDVFNRIFTMLSRKIPSHFEEIMPMEPAGRDRIIDAVSNLMIDFAKLRHLDVTILTYTLEDWFKRRYKPNL